MADRMARNVMVSTLRTGWMAALAALVALLLLAASAAQAASIQYSFSNGYVKTEVNQGGSLRFFDQSLGRLTGVSFSFDGGLQTWISLTNNSNDGDTLVGTSTSALFYSTDFGGLNSLIAADTPMLELKAVVKESVDAGRRVGRHQCSSQSGAAA